MSSKNFYKNQSGTFQAYIKNTNQKEILAKNIVKKISSSFNLSKDKEFVFTDIGAGDGKVTIPVINFLHGKTNLICNIIEPSDLIEDFKKNCNFKNINYYKKKIDDLTIPKSDFILVSHILVYLDDLSKAVQDVYAALKDDGMVLIIETNPDSDDVKMKIKLKRVFASQKNLKMTGEIINFLKTNSIRHQAEVIPSEINTSGCVSLNEDGKAIISFFYHKPFDELLEKEIVDFQTAVKQLTDGGNKLSKKEDYVWIYK